MLSSRANSSEKLLLYLLRCEISYGLELLSTEVRNSELNVNAPCPTDLVKTADAPFVREAVHRVRHR